MTIIVGNCGACGMPLIEPGGERQQCKFGATAPMCPFSHSNVVDRIADFEKRLDEAKTIIGTTVDLYGKQILALTERVDHLLKHADDWKGA